MTYDQRQQTYTLSSGRRFYAHGGYISISHPVANPALGEGYDGGIEVQRDWDTDFVPWTPAERAELADEMIRRWTVFKESDGHGRAPGLEDRDQDGR